MLLIDWVTPISGECEGLSKKSIAKATFIVALLGVISKILGFFREQLIAMFFGATGVTDAYVISLLASGLIAGALTGPISTTFLPVFSSYLASGDEEGSWRLSSSVITVSSSVLLVLSVIAIPFAPGLVRLVASGLQPEEFEIALGLTKILLPVMVIPLLAAFAKQILNSTKEFLVPGLQPVIQNLVIVAIVSLFSPVMGVWALPMALMLGYMSALLIQIPSLRKVGFWFRPSFRMGEGSRKVVSLAVPLMLGSVFSQIYQVIDKGLASHLPAGSIAALNFADRLRQLPLGLFVTAVVTVIYPNLSEMWARKDENGLRDTINLGLRYVAFITVPSAIGLMVLSKPLVRLIYERGAFTPGATLLTAKALLAYSPGLVAMAASQVISTSFYASQETRLPVILSIGTSLFNIAIDFLLIRFMAHVGLALANSISAWVGVALSIYVFHRFVARLSLRSLASSSLRILLASLLMGFSAWCLGQLTGFYQEQMSFARDALTAFTVILAAGIIYLLAAWFLKCEEMTMFVNMVKEKLGFGRKE